MGPRPSMPAPRRLTRRQLRELPYVDNPMPFRRLAAAALLQATLDARTGDTAAVRWLHSDQAHEWAGLLDLPTWPPKIEQLGSRAELIKRGRAPAAAPLEPIGRIRSRNPADNAREVLALPFPVGDPAGD
jgi:hypothetical protein